MRSLGSKTDWSGMAREMDVPLGRGRGASSHHTLRDYIELLAGAYFLFIVYFWRTGLPANNLSNEKKVFFVDPLLHVDLRSAAGLRRAHQARPVVIASQDELLFAESYAVIPAYLLLWAPG